MRSLLHKKIIYLVHLTKFVFSHRPQESIYFFNKMKLSEDTRNAETNGIEDLELLFFSQMRNSRDMQMLLCFFFCVIFIWENVWIAYKCIK